MKSRILWILLVVAAILGGFGAKMWRDSVVKERAGKPETRRVNQRPAADEAIRNLKRAIRDQEDLVDDLGKVMKTLVQTKALIYKGPPLSDGDCDDPPMCPQDKEAEDRYAKLEEEETRLELCLAHFIYLEEAPLMTYANELDLPDNPVKQAFPAYLEALRGRAELRNQGLDEQRPEVQTASHNLSDARTKTRKAVEDLRAGLQTQREAVEQQSKTAGEHLKRAVMFNVNTRFEAEQEILQLMRGKLARLEEPQKIDLKQPPNH